MRGFSTSIPMGMIFKKYYCSHCGNKLIKEKTHRVVTKDDKDYYQYHDVGNFPKLDYNVYSYQFKCPHCNKRIAYKEQVIINQIQKDYKSKVLSPIQIKEKYKFYKNKISKRDYINNLIIPCIFILIFFVLFFFFATDKTRKDLILVIVLCLVFMGINLISSIRSHKGKNILKYNKKYSYDENNKIEKLHAYSSGNKYLIEKSNFCYCFYCKKEMKASEIESYLKDGTALCPNCSIDAIIPDAIEERIDKETIELMNKYWF